MIKRILLASSLMLAAVGVGSAATAQAAYPAGCATVTTGYASVTPNFILTVVASGYDGPSVGMTITFYMVATSADHTEGASIIGTAVVTAARTATITPIIAPAAYGSYDIIAVGGNCADAITTFEVGATIVRTGSDSTMWLQTAAVLVLLGLGFALVAYRRRPAMAAAA